MPNVDCYESLGYKRKSGEGIDTSHYIKILYTRKDHSVMFASIYLLDSLL